MPEEPSASISTSGNNTNMMSTLPRTPLNPVEDTFSIRAKDTTPLHSPVEPKTFAPNMTSVPPAKPTFYELSDDDEPPRKRRKRLHSTKPGQSCGRWTEEEHQAFLDGLRECGREWKKVALRIPSRSSAQIRSHAQKYFARLEKDEQNDTPSKEPAAVVIEEPCEVTSRDSPRWSPSLKRNVKRILANPSAVRKEVEETLMALRARYLELQRRLAPVQPAPKRAFIHHHRADPRTPSPAPMSTSRANIENEVTPIQTTSTFGPQRRRILEEFVQVQNQTLRNLRASVITMEKDELIALHVLGGSLPKGGRQSSSLWTEIVQEMTD
eukprot:Nitzschia sp. Nitz4//scaffold175_size95217//35230//36204//NITZ4_004721-RA/size95217-processed-gene-0.50-mRNA-1//1//CDS//3329538933//131//frame0